MIELVNFGQEMIKWQPTGQGQCPDSIDMVSILRRRLKCFEVAKHSLQRLSLEVELLIFPRGSIRVFQSLADPRYEA